MSQADKQDKPKSDQTNSVQKSQTVKKKQMPQSDTLEDDNEDNVEQTSEKSSAERKSEYRDLLDQAEILQENEKTGIETAIAVDEILHRANELFKTGSAQKEIKHTEEIMLDSKVIAAASSILVNVSKAIDCSVDKYDPKELARKIKSQFSCDDGSNEINWSKLSTISDVIMKQPPNFTYLYGSFKPNVVKKRKPRQLKQKTEQVARKQPEKIVEADKEEDSVDDTVKFLHWALNKEFEKNKKTKISYFHFVVDPNSYTATIENIFHLSFLVRDGKVRAETDENDLIYLYPVSNEELKKAKKEGSDYKQCVISIDYDTWKELKEFLQIESSLLSQWKTKWDAKN